MKNKTLIPIYILISFLLISFLSACAASQPAPAPEPKPSSEENSAAATAVATGWPAAFVPEPVYEFGTVVDGSKIVHEFVIENQGEGPLRISDIVTGCTCAVPEYPKILFPGQKGVIKISIDTNGFGGREFSKVILVSTNEPNNPILKLMISGQISLFADITPKSLILKGLVGEKVEAAAVITPYKEYPFTITGIEIEDKLKEMVSVDIHRKGETFILTAKNKIKSAGQYLGKLILKTDSSIKPEIKIFVRGTIQ